MFKGLIMKVSNVVSGSENFYSGITDCTVICDGLKIQLISDMAFLVLNERLIW